MLRRLLAAMFVLALGLAAETMSIDQLFAFIQSSTQLIKEGRMTDRELASFLSRSTLTQRLDDRTLEQMQSLGIGPRTLEALQKLRDQSRALAVAKPVEPPAAPRQAPPPSSEEQAAIIARVREYALNYSRGLPDFICTQVTRRYAAPARSARALVDPLAEPVWQAMDTLTIRLSYFEQKEDYKLILVNNSITTQDYANVGGATVSGDFGSMLRDIFDRSTQARFEWDHWATLRSRPAMAFAYRVSQANSKWHVTYGREYDVIPAYRGLIYVDPKTHEVFRVTFEAEGLPPGFPVKMAQSILDYDYQDLSGQRFLLPLKSRSTSAAGDYMSRNDTEFRIYRKYSAESLIRFDVETPEPLPESDFKAAPGTQPPGKK